MKKCTSILLVLILFFSCFALGEGGARVSPAEILKEMSTEQKVAQILMPSFYHLEDEKGENKTDVKEMYPEMEEIIRKYGFGGIIFNLRNARENAAAARLVDAVQTLNASVPGRTQLITCTDQEGGYVTRLGQGTQMPGSMALGAVNDPAVTEEAARLIGEEVTAIGYSGTFGPVMDVNCDPSNPVIGIRSFGDTPEMVVRHGLAFIKGLHEAGSLCTLKHFPGHGDTDTDSHTGLPCIDKTYEELKALELIPFQAGIDAGADMIMTAHIVYPKVETGTYISKETGEEVGLPATLSRTILTDILRGDMGFKGLIVTDAMNMDAIVKHFDLLDTAKLAIEAGVNLILRPVDTAVPSGVAALDKYIQDVAAMADEGKISMEALDKAVLQVLAFKEAHGMLAPYETGRTEERVKKAVETVGTRAHHELEFEIAKKAVTPVKNEGMFPLDAEASAAILVPYESMVKSAEYAVARLKDEGKLPADKEIPAYWISSMTVGDLKKVAQGTKQILAFSVSYSAPAMNPAVKQGADTALLDTIITLAHAAGNKIAVLSAHLPYDTAHYQAADALVITFGERGMSEDPREKEDGVTQYGPNVPAALYLILSGGEMPGKLPVTIPKMDENAQFTKETLYPAGFSVN